MKFYTKFLLAFAFVAGSLTMANAQIKLGAGAMTGLPMGTPFGDLYSFGIGGGVSGEYMVSDNIGVGLQVGFMSFAGEEIVPGFEAEPVTMIPIHVQGNYHFMPDEDFNFYGGLGLGINMITQTVVTQNIDFNTGTVTTDEESVSDSQFVIAPRVGANYMFSDALGVDLNVGYALAGDFSYLPINLGLIYVLD